MKSARDLNARDMYDEEVFEKAGKGAVPKTYKEFPRKRHNLTNVILTKKK